MRGRRPELRIVDIATETRRYVCLSVAADYLNVTRKTLGEWLDEGRLPHANFGSRRRVLIADLLAFERKARRST